MCAAARETAKVPSFSASIRLFERAKDYDRKLTVAVAKGPHNQTEFVECGERLARILKDLPPYEEQTTTNVEGDTSLFEPSALSDSALAFLRRATLKATVVD
jgi:hypothetical protein